jgi:hypothetical protein
MLAEAEDCKNVKELEAWRLAIVDHVEKFMRPEYQSAALADVQRRLMQRFAQLRNPERSFRELLLQADKCQSERELLAWRSSLENSIETDMPPDMKQFALADVQRHFEGRMSQLHEHHITEARALGRIFADADKCMSEAELRLWRQRAASHIREYVSQAFQIPALGDMQMRFERRMKVLQRGPAYSNDGSGSSLPVSSPAERNTTIAMSEPHPAGSGSVVLMVLLGLGLPAVMAAVGSILRAHKAGHGTSGRLTDVRRLEA